MPKGISTEILVYTQIWKFKEINAPGSNLCPVGTKSGHFSTQCLRQMDLALQSISSRVEAQIPTMVTSPIVQPILQFQKPSLF